MLKKKDEEITNVNTTVTTLKNHVFKLVGENFLWKKVAKDTAADVRKLKGELELVKREFAAASDAEENFLWKKVAKDTAADVRTLKGELEQE
ncbi:hypothetical protein QJS10_CPA08g00533 [Acorus calamus]|uniref:Uncharacterized protein n=1 Tax=Acorus calamus TaxID=4465 RepID=A0AAV9EB56_ACOCL|nr:hypothetical protein QJS10_CPA08g00533 [Acorus calamus]